MDCAPGVLPLEEAVLGGRAADVAGGFVPDTARFTPSVTEARGFVVAEALRADTPASGEATEARGVGRATGVGAFAAAVAGALATVAGAFAAGVADLTPGARDCRRVAVPGTGGGGKFDARSKCSKS